MALEIRELVVRVTITSGNQQQQVLPDNRTLQQLKEKIIKECMQQLRAGQYATNEER